MICRNCHEETGDEALVDLGMQPLANSLVMEWEKSLEPRYPLRPVICKNWHCRLIQLPELPGGVGFGPDYPYRSGQSSQWIAHLGDLVRTVPTLGEPACVVDVGGNDGTLGTLLPSRIQYVNIDPSAQSDRPNSTLKAFMSREVAAALPNLHADWVVANNVMAHVPDLDDFLGGIRAIMKDDGLLTVEVQDVNAMIENGEWDCVYHEHYSYFNRQTLMDAIERRGFFVYHTESIPTHGGSIRVYAHKNLLVDHPLHAIPLRIMKHYPKWPNDKGLWLQAHLCREWAAAGKRVVGYGAPAKAMTWLNSFKRPVPLNYIVDSTPEKIGKFTPGSHIPIHGPGYLYAHRKDVDIVVILAWNWGDEILPKIPAGPEVWCRGERLR